MKDLKEIAQITVAEFLTAAPNASRMFIQWRTACVGCPLARFCTLTEVVEIHGLDESQFLEALSNFFTHNFNKENIQ